MARESITVHKTTIDEVESILSKKGAMSPANAPRKARQRGYLDFPEAADGVNDFVDRDGNKVRRVPTCRDVNENMDYGWASIRALNEDPKWSYGWHIVEADNEWGANIRDREFTSDGNRRIRRGGLYLVAALRVFSEDQSSIPVNETAATVRSVLPPDLGGDSPMFAPGVIMKSGAITQTEVSIPRGCSDMAIVGTGLYLPGFRYVRGSAGIPVPTLGPPRSIKSGGITRAAVAGASFWKTTATGIDTLAAGDTTTAAGNIIGLGLIYFDAAGNQVEYGYFATGRTTGFVQCIEDPAAVYEGVEDADGGAIAATGTYVGSVALAVGTPDFEIGNYGGTQVQPFAGDKLDSSTKSATLTTNAFILVGKSPVITNDGGPVAAAPVFSWQFTIGSTFKAPRA